MATEEGSDLEKQIRDVLVRCPNCNKQDKLKIPVKIIDQSKQLTTVSVPSGLVCDHSFQAFVDKNFKIRGYQKVDYELSKMEYFEGSTETIEDEPGGKHEPSVLSSIPFFQDIIQMLRDTIDDEDILGAGIFTPKGKVLYSSLPHETLFTTIREFESREKKSLVGLKRLLLELETNQKICSEYIEIYGQKFILVLFFASHLKFGMAILLLTRLSESIVKMV